MATRRTERINRGDVSEESPRAEARGANLIATLTGAHIVCFEQIPRSHVPGLWPAAANLPGVAQHQPCQCSTFCNIYTSIFWFFGLYIVLFLTTTTWTSS